MHLPTTAHLHLLLNHFPTIGTIIALGLFLLALVRKNDHLKHASFEVFFIIALVTLPAYLSGVAAGRAIQELPGVNATAITAHHDAALIAYVFMQLTGLFAWLGLWQFRRFSQPTRSTSAAVLLLSVVTLVLMAQAANVGGEVRHPEILVDESLATQVGAGWMTSGAIAGAVQNIPWIWPAAETVHFMGLSLIFGVLAIVNFRILGMMRGIPFAALHRLLPWAVLGFAINFVTGMIFFIAAPEQYTENVSFYWKIALMLVAGGNLLYLTVVKRTFALEQGDDAPPLEKAMAVSSVGLWVGVMYFGRMLPFIGNAF